MNIAQVFCRNSSRSKFRKIVESSAEKTSAISIWFFALSGAARVLTCSDKFYSSKLLRPVFTSKDTSDTSYPTFIYFILTKLLIIFNHRNPNAMTSKINCTKGEYLLHQNYESLKLYILFFMALHLPRG